MSTAAPDAAVAACAAMRAVRDNHSLFLRSLTSRLGEVKDVAHAWRAGAAGEATDGAYLHALRRVRDACHEWTAADVLRALSANHGSVHVEGAPGDDVVAIALRGGVPAWSWPAYPRTPWVSLLCPVVASLLCSCYEDWLLPACDACGAMLGAAAPLIAAACACHEDDLWPPTLADLTDLPAPAGGDAGAAGAAAVHEGSDRAAAMQRHAAATCAVSFTRHAAPLLPALACAAQCASPAVRRAAGAHARSLRGMLDAVGHLTTAVASGSVPHQLEASFVGAGTAGAPEEDG